MEDKAAGVGGIVGDGEGIDVNRANGKVLPGTEIFDRGKKGGIDFGFGRSGAQSSFFIYG